MKSRTNKHRGMKLWRVALVPISILIGLLIWDLAVRIKPVEPFILPSPALVWDRFLSVLMDGSLVRHLLTTLTEVVLGLIIGVMIASITGYFLAKSPIVEQLLSPYIVASQSVPIVAIAPLLIIWFGSGISSKVLICALIVFFPVLVNTIVGLRTVPEDLRDLMRSLQASRSQTIRLLEIPCGNANISWEDYGLAQPCL